MQDMTTGQMLPLDQKRILESISTLEANPRQSLLDRAKREAVALQKEMDRIQPDRSRQGPVFCVGETFELRGGKFKVVAITKKGLVLNGVPK